YAGHVNIDTYQSDRSCKYRLSQALLIYVFLFSDHFANQGNNKCLPEGVLEDSQQLVVINKQRKCHLFQYDVNKSKENIYTLIIKAIQDKGKIYGHEKRINMTGIQEIDGRERQGERELYILQQNPFGAFLVFNHLQKIIFYSVGLSPFFLLRGITLKRGMLKRGIKLIIIFDGRTNVEYMVNNYCVLMLLNYIPLLMTWHTEFSYLESKYILHRSPQEGKLMEKCCSIFFVNQLAYISYNTVTTSLLTFLTVCQSFVNHLFINSNNNNSKQFINKFLPFSIFLQPNGYFMFLPFFLFGL
ncbi:hypothetical protein ACJX0J_019346, partial [Zea mays]